MYCLISVSTGQKLGHCVNTSPWTKDLRVNKITNNHTPLNLGSDYAASNASVRGG